VHTGASQIEVFVLFVVNVLQGVKWWNAGVEPEPFELGEHLVTASEKLVVVDRLLAYVRPLGHKVLIFSQMTRVLDILQDYLGYRGVLASAVSGIYERDICCHCQPVQYCDSLSEQVETETEADRLTSCPLETEVMMRVTGSAWPAVHLKQRWWCMSLVRLCWLGNGAEGEAAEKKGFQLKQGSVCVCVL